MRVRLNIGTAALITGEVDDDITSALNLMLLAIEQPDNVTTIIERGVAMHIRNSRIILAADA